MANAGHFVVGGYQVAAKISTSASCMSHPAKRIEETSVSAKVVYHGFSILTSSSYGVAC